MTFLKSFLRACIMTIMILYRDNLIMKYAIKDFILKFTFPGTSWFFQFLSPRIITREFYFFLKTFKISFDLFFHNKFFISATKNIYKIETGDYVCILYIRRKSFQISLRKVLVWWKFSNCRFVTTTTILFIFIYSIWMLPYIKRIVLGLLYFVMDLKLTSYRMFRYTLLSLGLPHNFKCN